MNQPMIITANYELDYKVFAIPIILMVGIIGSGILVVASRRVGTFHEAPDDGQSSEGGGQGVVKFCDRCGEPVAEDWGHCTHCGKNLKAAGKAQDISSRKGGKENT